MELPHPLTGELFGSPVPPGAGWPGDPAVRGTRVARDADEVVRLARTGELHELDARVSVCRACPRLVEWREDVAVSKRKSFANQPYWGRPIPGWGADEPRILIAGLAPAANGGNRTGRVFTGDRSGDWLFASLYRVGLANQPTSEHAGDGLRLIGTRMIAAVRCAPPANKPTPAERDTCAPWYNRELELVLPTTKAIVCLGKFGFDALLTALAALGATVPKPRPKFGHAAEYLIKTPHGDLTVLASFHPSQQNTFTGKLTEPMLDQVLTRAKTLAGLDGPAIAG
ncbi:uracil-DNA glycosylase [Kribbella solani]|uniref:uracil-DNA glycosylase n=1 Tax=Kribbella solani TaxID=236067 RepID=UPI0029B8DC90|nr:uracil-DNA glycosylase [Kribbella solani]MDX3004143.1 uracil-DNA glycosylase [Kribbella solani]